MNSINVNNLAAVMRSNGVPAALARIYARDLDRRNYVPSQVRTALRLATVDAFMVRVYAA